MSRILSTRGGGHTWWGGAVWQGCMHGSGGCMVGGMHGGGLAWWGHAWCEGGMCDRGHAWQAACVARGHAWLGVHGREGMVRGMHGRGDVHDRGCAWQGACVAGGGMRGTHPTGMHSC